MTTQEIVTTSGQLAPLFGEFVAYIDRGQRTTQTYLTNLRQFAAWLNYAEIRQPVRDDVLAYRAFLTGEHPAIVYAREAPGWAYRLDGNGRRYTVTCKPGTVAQYIRAVRSFFRWTASRGLYPDIAANVHMPKVRADWHSRDALGPQDVARIEESITEDAGTEKGKRLLAMYLLAVTAGLRTIELERANVKDLQTRGGEAWLYVWGKGHAEADARKPLAPEVYRAVKDYLGSRTDRYTGSSPLFVATGNRSGGRRIAARTISQMLKAAMRGAGYDSERLTAHSLRHTAGTSTMELTHDLYITQRYMRHASPKTTEIYLHNDTERQEAAIARQLYGFYHGGSAGAVGR